MNTILTLDPIPAVMSVSALRQTEIGTLLTCGRKFYLERVLGNKWTGNRKTFGGTAFHKGLESVYHSLMVGDQVDWAEAQGWAASNLETSVMLAPDEALALEGEETIQAVLTSGQEYVRLALDHYEANVFPGIAALGAPLAVEERVSFTYRGIEIAGTVDLIDNQGVLHDHKLTNAYLSDGEMPHNYWSQLSRYAWFWLQAQGIPLTGVSLDMISTAKLRNKTAGKRMVESRPFTDMDIDRMVRVGKESVDQAIDLLKMGLFSRNAINGFGGICDFCPHRGEKCLG